MANGRSSKWQTERARREKAALKREKKDQRVAPESEAATGTEATQGDVLAALAALHESYADGNVSLDDFESAKEALIGQLIVE